MTQYANGAALERQVADDLRTRGWWVVRAAGSHGAADLVALSRHADPLLVQVKASGAISRAEWGELWDAADHVGGFALVADRARSESDRRRTWIRYRRLAGPREGARREWEVVVPDWGQG